MELFNTKNYVEYTKCHKSHVIGHHESK